MHGGRPGAPGTLRAAEELLTSPGEPETCEVLAAFEKLGEGDE